MPILNLQRRQTEVGRIRIGESVDTGKTTKSGQPIRRPVKLQSFRFTSASKTLIDQVAGIYGGTPAQWEPQGGGAPQWEVYTETAAIPVVVPPNSVSQWYEAWNAGLCQRRCDGQREVLKDRPCVCPADPAERDPRNDCKPTTRIALMLADVPGIGVWRLETHGYYAATELPAVAELLAAAGGFVVGRLELEQRTAKRPKANGGGTETRHWMVPVLHVDSAPRELVAGGVVNGPGAPPALVGGTAPAIEAAPALTADRVVELAGHATTVGQVQRLWKDAADGGVLTDLVKDALKGRAAELGAPVKPVSAPPAPPVVAAPAAGELEPDANAIWSAIMLLPAAAAWGSAGLEERVQQFLGKSSVDADGWELQRFLDAYRDAQVAA